MIMIKSYKKFTEEKLNEGIFDFLKSMFTHMFKGISELYNQETQKVFNDIQKETKPEAVYTILNKFLVNNKKVFNTDIQNSTTLLHIRDAVYSNIISLYVSFNTAAKKLSNGKVSFETIMGKTNQKDIKNIFNQKDDQKRMNLVLIFANNLIETLGKGLNIDIKEFDELKKPVGTVEEEKTTTEPTVEKPTETPTTEPTVEKPTETPTTEPTEAQKDQTNQIKDSFNYINEALTDDQLKKLKDIVKTWFETNIYKILVQNLNISIKEKPNDGDIDKMVADITSTQNKDGVKKMLQKIAQLNDPKKYAEVRDALAKLGLLDATEINKF